MSAPRLGLKSDETFGNMNFSMSWWAITEPFQMVDEHHAHDFDQYLIFVEGKPFQHDRSWRVGGIDPERRRGKQRNVPYYRGDKRVHTKGIIPLPVKF